MAEQCCGQCRFWKRNREREETEVGHCRRHAPKPEANRQKVIFGRLLWAVEAGANVERDETFDHLAENGNHWVDWPTTMDDEWCGEFEAKAEPKGTMDGQIQR